MLDDTRLKIRVHMADSKQVVLFNHRTCIDVNVIM